jgi:hypothetical protein
MMRAMRDRSVVADPAIRAKAIALSPMYQRYG